jgi:hypothetical protein
MVVITHMYCAGRFGDGNTSSSEVDAFFSLLNIVER